MSFLTFLVVWIIVAFGIGAITCSAVFGVGPWKLPSEGEDE